MSKTPALRRWYRIHVWSSLICTLFLLVACVTGLPLVFKDELLDWSNPVPARVAAEGAARADLDRIVQSARGPGGLFPGETVRWISLEDDRPEVWVALAPSYSSARGLDHVVKFDAYSGEALARPSSAATTVPFVVGVLFRVHKELLAGEVGEGVLGVMGLLVIVATVSGVVLYGRYMGKQDFGVVRRQRGRRLAWLDLHNLLGIATTVWVLVVGVTGVLNEIAEPAYDRWRTQTLADMLGPFRGKPMPTVTASVQEAIDTASAALPGMRIRSVRYPDGELGSTHHFLVWAMGDSALTSRLYRPVLIDAASGELARIGVVPWTLTIVQLARPLHFGDYGGVPLKVLWMALDLVAIGVLGSGLYLWWTRRRARDARIVDLARAHGALRGRGAGRHTGAASVATTAARRPSVAWRTWRAPLALAALTTAGLLAALLGSGAWQWVAWGALAVPPGCCAWFGLPLALRRRASRPGPGKSQI